VRADELAGRIVELDHNVVDMFDAFPVLAAILPEEARCTANRR
jgi:hypothetical protein